MAARKQKRMSAQVVEDEDYQLRYEVAAGIDVAKESAVVCVRLAVQLVSSSQARNLPGRPKTDKEDARWIARLTEMGMLRSSFVPPPQIRALRVYTRHIWDLTESGSPRTWPRSPPPGAWTPAALPGRGPGGPLTLPRSRPRSGWMRSPAWAGNPPWR